MPFVEQDTQSGFLFGPYPAHDITVPKDSRRPKTPKKQEHGSRRPLPAARDGPVSAATRRVRVT